MWVEAVPAGWMMNKYLFGFSERTAAPEDAPVRAYLAEHKLEPRSRHQEEYEGESFEVLCYGECYLGPHLRQIADLAKQHAGVDAR